MLPLQKKDPFALTDKQKADLESEDSFLRGAQALDILNKAIKETGVAIPKDFVFKEYDKGVAAKAINNTFGLLGGVPAFLIWAQANPSDYYRMFAKVNANEAGTAGGTAIQIVTSLPTTVHDNKSMNEQGFVTATANSRMDEPSSSPRAVNPNGVRIKPIKKSVLEDDDDTDDDT